MFRKQTLLAYTSILPAFLAFSGAAYAQEISTPKYEVGLNYSWLHVNSANNDYQRTGNGGSGYFEYKLNKTVGLVADFGRGQHAEGHQRQVADLYARPTL